MVTDVAEFELTDVTSEAAATELDASAAAGVRGVSSIALVEGQFGQQLGTVPGGHCETVIEVVILKFESVT